MKLKEYITVLKEIEQTHPDVDVVCSGDEEGNSFSPVHFIPSLGRYDGLEWESHIELDSKSKVNAVCIN